MSTPPPAAAGAASAAVDAVTLRDAAGPSYAGEWALFCDYATATGQPALPTTVATLTGFLTALPARPATLARRIRAIATAHRHAGHLLDRPDGGPAAPSPPVPRRPRWTEPGPMIAACPTRGWPHGLHGRRDAFLVVLTASLALPYPAAQVLTPAAIVINNPADPPTSHDVDNIDEVVAVAGRAVPNDADPRACPRCAVVRWLDILGTLDGLGRGSARMDLVTAHALTSNDPHTHRPRPPYRWRGAATLLPAIDQHGWLDDYRPITIRTIRTRLAAARGVQPAFDGRALQKPAEEPSHAGSIGSTDFTLDEVLVVLDTVADDVDTLNTHIQALLDHDHQCVNSSRKLTP